MEDLDSLFFDQQLASTQMKRKNLVSDKTEFLTLGTQPHFNLTSEKSCFPWSQIPSPDHLSLTQAFLHPTQKQQKGWNPPNQRSTNHETQESTGIRHVPEAPVFSPSSMSLTQATSGSNNHGFSQKPRESYVSSSTQSQKPALVGVVPPQVTPNRLFTRPVFRNTLQVRHQEPATPAPYTGNQYRWSTAEDDMMGAVDSHIGHYNTPQALSVPAMTPGGSNNGLLKLRPVAELPESYRSLFNFPYFNAVQSKVFDEVVYTDRPLVLCAPTGSGKTAVFELAMIRLLMNNHGSDAKYKVVYMAPIKALCSERYEDWNSKFAPLGVQCKQLTGDTELDDYYEFQNVHVILTTPEKWDSMTRRWRDNKSLVQQVRLFLIDEAHMLNDETRGATMEAVVSRMKTIQSAVPGSCRDENAYFRFIAVSATIPNVDDVAAWLGTSKGDAFHHSVDDSYRPVRLRKVVLGYPCSANLNEFRFDLSLNYKLSSVIETYSEQKPTLVFCATRKGVQQTATMLVKDARFIINAQHKVRLQACANSVKDAKLRDLLLLGVGFHHAGMDQQDRKAVEAIFTQGDLPVLIATSTLAMGVNMPAHLVVIKSTQHYVMGMYQEYTETQVLQMIGRAGRPQFDTTATAVIMTKATTKSKYERLLQGTQVIESSLHLHLAEHVNAEVVLNTITDVSVALEWIRATFLYIRVMKNPKHYGIPVGLRKEQVEHRLQDLCLKNLNALAAFDLVSMDEDGFTLKPTELGRLMARYCVAFETMKRFHKLAGTESTEDLLRLLCSSEEFKDIQLRVNERTTLNTLNKDKHRATVRFPMNGKIKTSEMKVNCLLQAQLGCLPMSDFSLTQDVNKIFRSASRIVKCLVEVLWQRQHFTALHNAIVLAKSVRAKLWENSSFVARQLPGIGATLGTALVNAGVNTFQKLEERNPRELELIVNRHPPFGNQVHDAVSRLPKYELCIDQSNQFSEHVAEITLNVAMTNGELIADKGTAGTGHTCVMLIGDADNNIVFKSRISDAYLLKNGCWVQKVRVQRGRTADELQVHFISQDYVGLDVESTYTPFYIGPRRVTSGSKPQDVKAKTAARSTTGNKSKGQTVTNKIPVVMVVDDSRRPCSHHCERKDECAHECCKTGVPIRPTPSRNNSTMQNYKHELKNRVHQLQTTPAKRPKMCESNVNLDQFAYKPRHQYILPPETPRRLPNSENQQPVRGTIIAATPRLSLARQTPRQSIPITPHIVRETEEIPNPWDEEHWQSMDEDFSINQNACSDHELQMENFAKKKVGQVDMYEDRGETSDCEIVELDDGRLQVTGSDDEFDPYAVEDFQKHDNRKQEFKQCDVQKHSTPYQSIRDDDQDDEASWDIQGDWMEELIQDGNTSLDDFLPTINKRKQTIQKEVIDKNAAARNTSAFQNFSKKHKAYCTSSGTVAHQRIPEKFTQDKTEDTELNIASNRQVDFRSARSLISDDYGSLWNMSYRTQQGQNKSVDPSSNNASSPLQEITNCTYDITNNVSIDLNRSKETEHESWPELNETELDWGDDDDWEQQQCARKTDANKKLRTSSNILKQYTDSDLLEAEEQSKRNKPLLGNTSHNLMTAEKFASNISLPRSQLGQQWKSNPLNLPDTGFVKDRNKQPQQNHWDIFQARKKKMTFGTPSEDTGLYNNIFDGIF